MNKDLIRSATLVTGGAFIGAGTGYMIAKKHFIKKLDILEEMANQEIQALQQRIDDFEWEPEEAEKALDPDAPVYEDLVSQYNGEKLIAATKDAVDEAVETIKFDVETPTQAQRIITLDEVAPESAPTDISGVQNIFDKMANVPLEELRKELGVPYVITLQEFMQEELDFTKITLHYYAGDETLTDDQDALIDDVDGTIGNTNLDHFGHGSENDNTVYVRNDNRDADFEIIRVEGSYAELVLGETPKSEDG